LTIYTVLQYLPDLPLRQHEDCYDFVTWLLLYNHAVDWVIVLNNQMWYSSNDYRYRTVCHPPQFHLSKWQEEKDLAIRYLCQYWCM